MLPTLQAINTNVKLQLVLWKKFCVSVKVPHCVIRSRVETLAEPQQFASRPCASWELATQPKIIKWNYGFVLPKKGREVLTEIFTSFWLKCLTIICFSCCVFQSHFFCKAEGRHKRFQHNWVYTVQVTDYNLGLSSSSLLRPSFIPYSKENKNYDDKQPRQEGGKQKLDSDKSTRNGVLQLLGLAAWGER